MQLGDLVNKALKGIKKLNPHYEPNEPEYRKILKNKGWNDALTAVSININHQIGLNAQELNHTITFTMLDAELKKLWALRDTLSREVSDAYTAANRLASKGFIDSSREMDHITNTTINKQLSNVSARIEAMAVALDHIIYLNNDDPKNTTRALNHYGRMGSIYNGSYGHDHAIRPKPETTE